MTLNPGILALLQAPAPTGPSPMLWIVQIAAVFGIFYFLLIRPQRKAHRKHQEILAALKRGDQVMTEGGILGEVVHLADDRITIKSGDTRIVVVRGKISRILNAPEKSAAQ